MITLRQMFHPWTGPQSCSCTETHSEALLEKLAGTSLRLVPSLHTNQAHILQRSCTLHISLMACHMVIVLEKNPFAQFMRHVCWHEQSSRLTMAALSFRACVVGTVALLGSAKVRGWWCTGQPNLPPAPLASPRVFLAVTG